MNPISYFKFLPAGGGGIAHTVLLLVLQQAERERKQQRENQVTLYRKYRIGDLPDIQIKYSAIIAPLQALAQVSTGARPARHPNQELRYHCATAGPGAGKYWIETCPTSRLSTPLSSLCCMPWRR